MRGIYAHVNKINGRVFYVGQQRCHNNRAYDFKNQRSDRYKKYVEEIGIENVEVVWLYKSVDDNESLFPIESFYQHKYYQDGFLKTRELVQNGENNSNYGNHWSEEQRKRLSEKMKGRYVGKDNPNYGNHWTDEQKKKSSEAAKKRGSLSGVKNPKATACILYGPNGFEKKFDLLKDMTEWVSNNVIHGELKDPTAINRDFHFKKEYKVLDNWSYKTYTRH